MFERSGSVQCASTLAHPLRRHGVAPPCSSRAWAAPRCAMGGRMGRKSAFQAAPASPRGVFCADVAGYCLWRTATPRIDFCGEGPRLNGMPPPRGERRDGPNFLRAVSCSARTAPLMYNASCLVKHSAVGRVRALALLLLGLRARQGLRACPVLQ